MGRFLQTWLTFLCKALQVELIREHNVEDCPPVLEHKLRTYCKRNTSTVRYSHSLTPMICAVDAAVQIDSTNPKVSKSLMKTTAVFVNATAMFCCVRMVEMLSERIHQQ